MISAVSFGAELGDACGVTSRVVCARRTDLKFVEWGEEAEGAGAAAAAAVGAAAAGARVALPARLLPGFTAQDCVCRPFAGFSISEWDPSAEDRCAPTSPALVAPGVCLPPPLTRAVCCSAGAAAALDLSQQAVAFDVEADVEPVPEADHHDLYGTDRF